jgi:hypothetical protein
MNFSILSFPPKVKEMRCANCSFDCQHRMKNGKKMIFFLMPIWMRIILKKRYLILIFTLKFTILIFVEGKNNKLIDHLI